MSERKTNGQLLLRGKKTQRGEVVSLAPSGADWRYIRFRVIRLGAEESFEGFTAGNEAAIVVIGGRIAVNSSQGSFGDVGGRADPFSGPPSAVYLPALANYRVLASQPSEIAICEAPGSTRFAARAIRYPDDHGYVRGSGSAQRTIRDILMQDDAAESLFLTEVVTPPGHWSSYPPHKHDQDALPAESQLEELYYYRAQPAQGFAFQRIYSKSGDLDQTLTAHDGDAVLVPRGYHVCAAAEGYSIYYLNVLAGPKHVYRMTFDPDHEWIKENWKW